MANQSKQQESISDLAQSIVANVDGAVIQTELATSQRIIARVTDGIYREPWAAFRELIANAYDADATRVVVETGAPDFKQVVVRDDGNGMSPETVAYILKSIGGSSKRTGSGKNYNTVSGSNSELSPAGRPLIGKIGIGLFAVAQLTQHFQIITKSKGSKIRTSATILLRTHDEEKISGDEGEEYVAGDVKIASETVIDEDVDTHGTSIILYNLRPEIRRNLQSYNRWRMTEDNGPDSESVRERPAYHIGALPNQIPESKAGVEPNLPWDAQSGPKEKFSALVEAAKNISGRSRAPANLEHFDEYLKLIWNLSLALPLRYLHRHPFDFKGSENLYYFKLESGKSRVTDIELGVNETLRQKLELETLEEPGGLPFAVLVDNVELRRPIELPIKLRRASRIDKPMMVIGKVDSAFSANELDRAGGQLSFEAYLYWNSKIVPKETSGVLVRVREASGTLFDRSVLDYQTSEQNRLSQIIVEVFVRDGLDSAINIDRESFNYSHPHFLYIQKWVHRAVRLLINRNKQIGKADLERERAHQSATEKQQRVSAAVKVWDTKRGEDSDPPVPRSKPQTLPEEVGGVEIEWEKESKFSDNSKATAIAIVLEAYGVLSQLNSGERSRLVRDLLKVLDE